MIKVEYVIKVDDDEYFGHFESTQDLNLPQAAEMLVTNVGQQVASATILAPVKKRKKKTAKKPAQKKMWSPKPIIAKHLKDREAANALR